MPSRCPARAAPGGAGNLSELLNMFVDANITLQGNYGSTIMWIVGINSFGCLFTEQPT